MQTPSSAPLLPPHGRRVTGPCSVPCSVPVVIIQVMAVCTMVVMSCIDWTLLLYLNHIALVPRTNDFYITASALALCVPIVSNPILGLLSARFGSRKTLTYAYLAPAFGILLMLLFRASPVVFMAGYLLYALSTSYRIVRLSIIAELISSAHRTTVMAIHQLMAPIGACIGPWLWIHVQKWKSHISIANIFSVDRFTLYYSFAICLLVLMTVMGLLLLQNLACDQPPPVSLPDRSTTDVTYGAVNVTDLAQSADHTIREDAHGVSHCSTSRRDHIFKHSRFFYFSLLLLCMQSTMALVRVSFQPVLVDVYGMTEGGVGKMYAIVGGLAIIPPIMIALLARVLSDRAIALLGIMLKFCGASLWLPLFGPVRLWQCVAGFILCVKASQFFTTSIISAFTKTVGEKGSSKQLGFMWSICNLGPAVLQLGFASRAIAVYGTWWFVTSLLPVVVGLVMVMHPWGWKLLGEAREGSPDSTK